MKGTQLQIPEPCHEKWNEMTPTEQGRHCAACNKTVIDFSGRSDNQIVQFFKNKPAEVCGRFHADQLNRDLFEERKRTPWLKYLFTVALPSFLLAQRAVAQGEVRVKKAPVQCDSAVKPVVAPERVNILDDTERRPLIVGKLAPPSTAARIFEGRVTDERGEPLRYASIVVMGTNHGTITDSTGAFRLTWKGAVAPTVSVSHINYSTKQIQLQQTGNNIMLKPQDEEVLAGFVVVSAKRTKNPKKMPRRESVKPQMAPRIAPALSLQVYPNPVPSGASFRIEASAFPAGEYELSLLTLQGTTVNQRRLALDGKSSGLTESTTGLAAGSYVLRLVNRSTGVVYSEKVVVL